MVSSVLRCSSPRAFCLRRTASLPWRAIVAKSLLSPSRSASLSTRASVSGCPGPSTFRLAATTWRSRRVAPSMSPPFAMATASL